MSDRVLKWWLIASVTAMVLYVSFLFWSGLHIR
jgi:hypothetical protein